MLSISANLHPGLLIARVIGTMQPRRAQGTPNAQTDGRDRQTEDK